MVPFGKTNGAGLVGDFPKIYGYLVLTFRLMEGQGAQRVQIRRVFQI
jgi:hypothetical protein